MPEVNMKDTFSTYHPLLNMLYFVGVIGVTVFVVHPVILAISLFGGIAYSVLLKGWKKTVKFNLIFSIPMMLIVALMNPMFNHYGVTIIGYLHNGNPFTLESCVYGLVMAMMLVCTMIWFSCYTIVMTSDKFIYLFGKIIPALSLVLSMCLRFVPKFIREAGVISDGQKCIGRSTENGSLVKRAKHGITIFSILVTWALALFGFSKGYTFCQYNPKIIVKGIPLTAGSLLVYLAFLLFSVLPVVLELWDRYQWKQRRKQVEKAEQANYRLWEVQD